MATNLSTTSSFEKYLLSAPREIVFPECLREVTSAMFGTNGPSTSITHFWLEDEGEEKEQEKERGEGEEERRVSGKRMRDL